MEAMERHVIVENSNGYMPVSPDKYSPVHLANNNTHQSNDLDEHASNVELVYRNIAGHGLEIVLSRELCTLTIYVLL